MIRHLFLDTRGAAAVELVLILPMALVLLFTSLEAGHFMWSEHKVIEAVRNGARFASRQTMSTVCPSQTGTIVSDVQTLTRTGKLGGTSPVVPGWTANSQVTVTYRCATFLSTGIYSQLGSAGATVTVSATNLNYPVLFSAFNSFTGAAHLNASASTAVIGI